MKHKFLGIVMCTLLITTVIPVVGFPIRPGEIKNSNMTQPHFQAPTPGDAPNQPPEMVIDIQTVRKPSEKTAVTMDEIVIDMLEQVDETIYLRYLENLTAFGPRVTGTDACNASAEYIYNQFESMGLTVRYHHWKTDGYESDNVEATLFGNDESSDEIYIICAHYDTHYWTLDDSPLGPGADDDTSGTVAVLMAAFIMSQYQFNHTIKFVAFSGEEEGIFGSFVYVTEAVENGWNIIGVLNADMISYAETTSDGNRLIVFQDDASEWLYDYTVDVSTEYVDYIQLILYSGGFSGGSDHYYFWMAGYSALFYYEYVTTPYYHTSEDTIEHINATYAVKVVRLLLATLAELSNASFNNPPNAPTITGEISGAKKTLYDYTIQTTDPDQDNVQYYIDWGDGNNSGWIGPYNSGQTAIASHSWESKGTYTIKVKAKDHYGFQSDWGTLTVTMPYSYHKSVPQLFEQLFQRFSNAFPLLRHLL